MVMCLKGGDSALGLERNLFFYNLQMGLKHTHTGMLCYLGPLFPLIRLIDGAKARRARQGAGCIR